MANVNLTDSTNIKVNESGSNISLDFTTTAQQTINKIDVVDENVGDIADLETEDVSSVVNAINSTLPVTLYSNSSGEGGTVVLSNSVSNYKYIEIYYKYGFCNSSVKIDDASGKQITLFGGTQEGDGAYILFKRIIIYDLSIGVSSYASAKLDAGGVMTYGTLNLLIYKVVGYK